MQPSADTLDIGKRLAAIRDKRSQTGIAKYFGISRVHWWKLEHGQARAGRPLLKLIALLEDVSEEWLLTGNGPGPSARHAEEGPGRTASLRGETAADRQHGPFLVLPLIRRAIHETRKADKNEDARRLVREVADMFEIEANEALARLIHMKLMPDDSKTA